MLKYYKIASLFKYYTMIAWGWVIHMINAKITMPYVFSTYVN